MEETADGGRSVGRCETQHLAERPWISERLAVYRVEQMIISIEMTIAPALNTTEDWQKVGGLPQRQIGDAAQA